MITLEKAALIYGEMENIFQTGNSKYLKEAIIQKDHKICNLMNNLNSKSILYMKSDLSAKDFIKSLKVDGIEVIGYKEKKHTHYYNSYITQEFFVNEEKIYELANPAPFGKGKETVYDEEVRKAFEIAADRINIETIKDIDFNDYFKNIIPNDKQFNFKLYKMQIYKEGGKFTRHKDTIHAPNHYATLVVSIPAEFKGGKLLLYDDNEGVEEWFSSYYSKSIIFLTDVDHEVTEVISGTRIILQYDVYLEETLKEEGEEEKDEDEYDEDSECIFNKNTKEFLASKEYIDNLQINIDKEIINEVELFMINNETDEVSFLLNRKYPLSISLENLKAGDRRLYDILSSKYLINIGYVVNNFTSNYDGDYDLEDKKRLKIMNYEDTNKFLEYFNDQNDSKDDVKNYIKTHLFIAGGDFNITKSTDYIEHTGNEAAQAEYTYVSAVLNCKKK